MISLKRTKKFGFVAVVVLLGGLATSCSNLFDSETKEEKPLVIKKESVACLKDATATIEKYTNDGSGDIARVIDCTVKAIDEFTSDTQGSESVHGYTRAELANFIEQYLTAADSKAAGDAPAYTEQGLNLKQLVLGGSSEKISKTEIAKIKSLLLRAKPILVKLGPDIKIALLKAEKANHEQVERAKAAVNELIDLISSEFDRAAPGRPDWDITDIVDALKRLDFKDASIEKWLPVVKVAKTMMMGGDEETLRPKEWSKMIRSIGTAFGLLIQFKYEVLENDDALGAGLPGIEIAMNDAFGLLESGIKANGGAIEGKSLKRLIDLVLARVTLPEKVQGLQAQTAKNLLPILLGKVLCGSQSEDCLKNQATDLTAGHVARLRALLYDWVAGQKTVNVAFAKRSTLPVASMSKALASNVIRPEHIKDQAKYQLALRAQKQLMGFFELGRPPLEDEQGRLLVMNKRELRDVTKKDLNKLNLLRTVVVAVLQGWSTNATNAKNLTGLTEAETDRVYKDLIPLGSDLKWMDTRNTQAGVRTFMETAIFMASSNGDSYLNLQEGVEWFTFVMSGGTLADKIYETEFEPQCALQQADILGKKKVEIQCFRKRFLATWSHYLTNMPHLVSWVRADGSGERARLMLSALESAARNKGQSNDPIDSSEFRSMIPIAQYMESLFARFDQNKNDLLDHEEVWSAFPLLQPFIKQLGKGNADSVEIQKTLLSYILEYGECPDTTLIDKAWIAYWVVARRFQSDSADRVQVLKVIASFGAANRRDRTKAIEAYYAENAKHLRPLLSTGAATDESASAKIAELFQCQKPAVPTLAELMKREHNLNVLAPQSGPIKATKFIANVKNLTENNPTLQRYCLPF